MLLLVQPMKNLRFRELGLKLPPPRPAILPLHPGCCGIALLWGCESRPDHLELWQKVSMGPARLADGDIICEESHRLGPCLQRGGSFKVI